MGWSCKKFPSWHSSALLKALHLHLHLFSNMQLHNHAVNSYRAIHFYEKMELRKLFLHKFTFTENFYKKILLQKFRAIP